MSQSSGRLKAALQSFQRPQSGCYCWRNRGIGKGLGYMEYPENTVYLVGHAKVASDNPISISYGIFFLPFVVDLHTHQIIDVSCNAILDISRDFIRSMLVGCDLLDGLDEAIRRVRSRYFGSSQKALVAALRDANGRLRDILSTQQINGYNTKSGGIAL